VGDTPLPEGWRLIKISGPLFFAAAERVFDELLEQCPGQRGLILYMDGVSLLDAGGLNAFLKFADLAAHEGTEIVVADLQFQPLRTLARANVQPRPGQLRFTGTLAEALETVGQAA
jgi:sulfate permease, SulP family